MSNEWKDYQENLREDFEYNFDAALDSIPNGWMNTFIPQFREELFEALGVYADEIMFYQTKEKFGELTVYWNFPDRDYYNEEDVKDINKLIPVVQDIIKKYVVISKDTCAVCGKPSTRITNYGWIAPLCDSCEPSTPRFYV